MSDLTTMTNNELVTLLCGGINFNKHVPQLRELKRRFAAAPKDSSGRLISPIGGCYSWPAFCLKYQKPQPHPRWQGNSPTRQQVLERSQMPLDRDVLLRRFLEDMHEAEIRYQELKELDDVAVIFRCVNDTAKRIFPPRKLKKSA